MTPIAKLRAAYPTLPEAYFRFLSVTNGAEGELGIEPGWVVVWRAEDAIEATEQYQLPEYLPGYFAFGSNGGGELFVFTIQGSNEDRAVMMVPAVGTSPEELEVIAPSFSEFEKHIGRS